MFKVLDFLSQHAEKIGNEWFKLMEWLLIISTLSFVSQLSDNLLIKGLWIVSVVILFIYCFFAYSEKYFEIAEPIDIKELGLKLFLIKSFKASIVCLSLIFFSQIITEMALELVKISGKLK